MIDISSPPSSSVAPADSAGGSAYYTVQQAAAALGISRVTVWRWIRAGHLPAARLGHRTVRIRRDDVERLLVAIGPTGPRSWIGRKRAAEDAAGDAAEDAAARGEAGGEPGASDHVVQFYDAEVFLLDAVGEFIGSALRAGDVGIVVATAAHRAGLEDRLHRAGVDVAAARAGDRYVALDAAETLSAFLRDGLPDPAGFAEVIGGLIARAVAGGRRVRVFGEMVALLAGEGNSTATVRLERLWNDLLKVHTFSLFCAYPMDGLGGEALADLLGDVCAEHDHVVPAESYMALPTPDDRLRAIAALQQKAKWLEAEIVERQRAEERLRAALAAAEDALRARDEFISIAAHELKTPVTSLSGFAQLALRQFERAGQLDSEHAARALRTIAGQGAKLSRLISQLFDISQLQAGRLTLEQQPVDLVALVGQVVGDARGWSGRHALTLTAPVALEAWADPLRLEQVLTNLLDNAIKYSPAGGPIEVALTRSAEDAVELSVRDHGLGIPSEKRDRIFERFYQAHRDRHRSGLGLGLFISREIVDLHGGEIRAEFPPDGGVCFVVRLPLRRYEASARPGAGSAEALVPFAREDVA